MNTAPYILIMAGGVGSRFWPASREYLPKQLSDKDMEKAIAEAMAETGAASVKDMGKVMAELKARYAGQMDFGKASALVKSKLG